MLLQFINSSTQTYDDEDIMAQLAGIWTNILKLQNVFGTLSKLDTYCAQVWVESCLSVAPTPSHSKPPRAMQHQLLRLGARREWLQVPGLLFVTSSLRGVGQVVFMNNPISGGCPTPHKTPKFQGGNLPTVYE